MLKLRLRRYARKHWWNGGLYLIRDIGRGSDGRFLCEYATSNPNGSKKWNPCIEGVRYADIQPLRVRAHG